MVLVELPQVVVVCGPCHALFHFFVMLSVLQQLYVFLLLRHLYLRVWSVGLTDDGLTVLGKSMCVRRLPTIFVVARRCS